MTKYKETVLPAMLGCFLVAGSVWAAGGHDHAGQAAPAKTAIKPYPLGVCLVSGEKLGEMGEPYRIVHGQQEIKFCCKGCTKDFNKTPEKFLKKMDDAVKQKADAEAAKAGKGSAHKMHDHSGHNH